jgi:hypothetical protein
LLGEQKVAHQVGGIAQSLGRDAGDLQHFQTDAHAWAENSGHEALGKAKTSGEIQFTAEIAKGTADGHEFLSDAYDLFWKERRFEGRFQV